ncbi:hypothetical protein GYM46_08435 [Brevundimonas mediterranea]|jgi:hypothetical protein|uniref:Uncharacterized protein n=2 Tax=Brevundimonas TaxID=41275 RepID=A0AB37E745_9CAUL|nr:MULTISPECIES: hypothetical protein [Brevundimonas]QIH72977.1 hypothetical protein GYM46_08435 [Brevundimonas mediterranea]
MSRQTNRVLVRLSALKVIGLMGVAWVGIGWLWSQPFTVSDSIEEFLTSGSKLARGWPFAAIASLGSGPIDVMCSI